MYTKLNATFFSKLSILDYTRTFDIFKEYICAQDKIQLSTSPYTQKNIFVCMKNRL